MRMLFDHGTPFPLRSALTGHRVTRTQDDGTGSATASCLLQRNAPGLICC